MRYAPERATAKGACSDFCYLYRSNLQHRHDPADRIHTTPPHPRVSPRHGRNRGQPAAAARRRAGASLHQTHLRRSFDQRKRRSRRPHGPLGHLRPAGPRARILLRPHARRRRRHAGACQIDAHGRRADNTRHTGPAQPRHMAGHLPLRIPQPRFGPPHRRHPNRIVRPQFRRQADALAEKLHLPETDHQTRESNDDSDKTQDRGPAYRRRAARTARLGIRDSRNARIPARRRRARTGRRSLLPLCARQQKGGSGPAHPRQGRCIRRKRTESGHPQLGRGVMPPGTPERRPEHERPGLRFPRPAPVRIPVRIPRTDEPHRAFPPQKQRRKPIPPPLSSGQSRPITEHARASYHPQGVRNRLFFRGRNHQFAFAQRIMGHEPTPDRISAARDARNPAARSLAADRPAGTVAQRYRHLVEQRHGHDIFGIGRGIGVKPDGVEDIPRRHLAGIVHARQRQSFGSHAVESVQNVVEQLLRTLLTADEVIQVGEAMVGLVAVAVLPDKTRKVIHLIAFPRNREELVQLRPERLAAGIETDQPLGVVRSEERLLPSVGFTVHVFVIGILIVEGRDPRAVVEPSAHQARRGVEEVLVI